MRNLITGFSVTDGGVLFRSDAERQSLAPGTQLTYRLSAERYCIGFSPPGGGIYSCPDEALAVRKAQCESCAEKELMGPCDRCIGATCGNPARRKDCVFTDHFVYLALYDADTVKVGVTRANRLETRIHEQGALGAIAIAAAGGQEVRRIEHAISGHGYREAVKLLPLLASAPVTPAQAEARLREELKRLRKRALDVRFMEKGPFVWCADGYPPACAHAPRQLNPAADPLAGVVVGIRGGLVLLEVPTEGSLDEQDEQPVELVACPLRSLVGREVLSVDQEMVGPAQGAFVF